MSDIRVRFAPSPTGKVHIGNIRAAIYNWLFARHTGGKFLLRVEDTDLERSTPEAIQVLFDCMKWLGLDWDEEVFYQTKNVKRHLEVVDQLLASGHAYKVERTSREGKTGVVTMFKMPKEGTIEFDDIVKGHMAKKAEDIQDFAIVRSDGSPIFHIANVVDDIDQRVTHIIRGDDHVENTFKHICIFRALGAEVPRYAHLSMIVNQQGKPYSKRDGAAFVGEYREQGYLPEALFNYLLLLGWNPGDDREVLSREEMVKLFELEKVHVTAAMFDPKKLAWMNGEYIKKIPAAEFRDMLVRSSASEGSSSGSLGEYAVSLRSRRLRADCLVGLSCRADTGEDKVPFGAWRLDSLLCLGRFPVRREGGREAAQEAGCEGAAPRPRGAFREGSRLVGAGAGGGGEGAVAGQRHGTVGASDPRCGLGPRRGNRSL